MASLHTITNFTGGLISNSAWSRMRNDSASRWSNLRVSSQGYLEPRKGNLPICDRTDVTQIFSYRNLIFAIANSRIKWGRISDDIDLYDFDPIVTVDDSKVFRFTAPPEGNQGIKDYVFVGNGIDTYAIPINDNAFASSGGSDTELDLSLDITYQIPGNFDAASGDKWTASFTEFKINIADESDFNDITALDVGTEIVVTDSSNTELGTFTFSEVPEVESDPVSLTRTIIVEGTWADQLSVATQAGGISYGLSITGTTRGAKAYPFYLPIPTLTIATVTQSTKTGFALGSCDKRYT